MKKMMMCLLLLCGVGALQAEPTAESVKRRVCQVLPSMYGWCSQEKALNLIDLVLEVKPQVCVEIGVFGGASVFPVASALKFLGEGVIIAIDPWDKFEAIRYFDPVIEQPHLAWWGGLNLDTIYTSYRSMLKRYALEEYCVTIRDTSENAVSKVDAIDILYIDGSVSEEVSKQDALLYLPKVRSGGYVWVNDCLGVNKQAALEVLLASCEPVKVICDGNCVLLRKK